jgi:hypothetical protein
LHHNPWGQIELIHAYQQVLSSQFERLSFPIGASKNFCCVRVGGDEFYKTNQDTSIWLLAFEVALVAAYPHASRVAKN